jgi:two-component system sensor histidine kinase FlrB
VQIAEGSLELRWNAGRALVSGDRSALAQALDNLIVNAIEHGGPTIVVAGRVLEGRLRIAVVDSGRSTRSRSRRSGPAEAIARLSGRRYRGHGLGVVRRVAADHGGRFVLRHSERGSLAALELPLAEAETGRAA